MREYSAVALQLLHGTVGCFGIVLIDARYHGYFYWQLIGQDDRLGRLQEITPATLCVFTAFCVFVLATPYSRFYTRRIAIADNLFETSLSIMLFFAWVVYPIIHLQYSHALLATLSILYSGSLFYWWRRIFAQQYLGLVRF